MDSKQIFKAGTEKSSYFLELVSRFAEKSDFLTNLHSQNSTLLSSCQFMQGGKVKVAELEAQLEKLLFGKPCQKRNVYGLRKLWYNLHELDQKESLCVLQLQSNKGLCNMYMTFKGVAIGMVYYSRINLE